MIDTLCHFIFIHGADIFADYSHTSQDSYTTFMLTQKGLNNDGASRASILMKTGACVGGTSTYPEYITLSFSRRCTDCTLTVIGYLSQFVGRRRAIVVAACKWTQITNPNASLTHLCISG